MTQLTVGQLKNAIKNLPNDTVVYIGDDEELNGIHHAFFIQACTKKELLDLCDYGDFKKGGLLIS